MLEQTINDLKKTELGRNLSKYRNTLETDQVQIRKDLPPKQFTIYRYLIGCTLHIAPIDVDSLGIYENVLGTRFLEDSVLVQYDVNGRTRFSRVSRKFIEAAKPKEGAKTNPRKTNVSHSVLAIEELSIEDQTELVNKVREDNEQSTIALNKLWLFYRKRIENLCRKIARQNGFMDRIDELVGYAFIEFRNFIINSFRADEGLRIITPFGYILERETTRYIKSLSREIKPSIEATEMLDRLETLSSVFYTQHGRKPSTEELSEMTQIDIEEASKFLESYRTLSTNVAVTAENIHKIHRGMSLTMIKKLLSIVDSFNRENGRLPSPDELKSLTGLKAEEIKENLKIASTFDTKSINAKIPGAENLEMEDILFKTSELNAFDMADLRMTREKLRLIIIEILKIVLAKKKGGVFEKQFEFVLNYYLSDTVQNTQQVALKMKTQMENIQYFIRSLREKLDNDFINLLENFRTNNLDYDEAILLAMGIRNDLILDSREANARESLRPIIIEILKIIFLKNKGDDFKKQFESVVDYYLSDNIGNIELGPDIKAMEKTIETIRIQLNDEFIDLLKNFRANNLDYDKAILLTMGIRNDLILDSREAKARCKKT